MTLVDVYSVMYRHGFLYRLLEEREPHQCISHKEMPTYAQHVEFVESRPYAHWYMIEVEPHVVGAIYLTDRREIGVQILKQFHRQGYAKRAVKELLKMHPGPALANVNPENNASKNLWKNLGGQVIQVTYEIRG